MLGARDAARPAGEVDRDALGEHDHQPPRPRPDRLRDARRASATARSPAARSRIIADLGAYQHAAHAVHPGARLPGDGRLLPDPGDRPALHRACSRTSVAPTRSAARAGPEATHWIELMMDQLADELGMDRLELRRKNFIPKDEFPYETALGIVYDSGDYQGTLDKLLEHFDLDGVPPRAGEAARARASTAASASRPTSRSAAWRRRARSARRASACRPAFWESAIVRVTPTGSATVYTGTSPHGQGHDTSFAQIAADRLGIDPQNVEVHPRRHRPGPVGLGHLRLALAGGRRRGGRARGREGAGEGQADLRGAARGRARGHRAGRRQVPGARLAGQGDDDGRDRRRGAHPAARAAGRHRAGPRGDVVLRPGELRLPVRRARLRGRRGRRDRQGRGRALRRGRRLRPGDQPDADRRPGPRRRRRTRSARRSTSRSSTTRTASSSPARSSTTRCRPRPRCRRFETDRTETPSPVNSLGVKGVGEAGTIAATPAVTNAVLDALEPLGVTELDMPLTPMRVWQAIQAAGRERAWAARDRAGPLAGRARRGRRQRALRRPDEGGAVVIPAEFDYEAPESLDEAIRMLHETARTPSCSPAATRCCR